MAFASRRVDSKGRRLLVNQPTQGGDAGPAYATAYTTGLSGTTGQNGNSVIMTFTPTVGSWPVGEVITPTVSGVAGSFSPTTISPSGSGAATSAFTPSATGTALLSSTSSPTMTNTTGAQNYTVTASGGGGSPVAPVAITGLTWTQWAPISSQPDMPWSTLIGEIVPTGGAGPFKFFWVTNPNNYEFGLYGQRGIVSAPYTPAPAATSDAVSVMITDNFGQTYTGNFTIDRTATIPAIFVGPRTIPANQNDGYFGMDVQVMPAGAGHSQGETTNITSDPSGQWNYAYNDLHANSVLSAGTYPLTIQSVGSSGTLTKSFSIVITSGTIAGPIYSTLNTVSTSMLANSVVGKVGCVTPNNRGVWSITDPSSTFQINSTTGVISCAVQPSSTGNFPITVTITDNTATCSQGITIPIAAGTTLPSSNMSMTVNSSLTNAALSVSIGTPSVTGVTGTKQWSIVSQSGENSSAVKEGNPNRFTINSSTGAVSGYCLSADTDGTSPGVYTIQLSCTDGINTCTKNFTVSVDWAPVTQTFYVGQGMSTAHPGVGFEHLVDLRVTLAGGYGVINPGTYRTLIYANADPNYYADDTGTLTSNYSARYPWPGPMIFEGVAANGVLQPRTGGNTSNNGASGGDMAGKGFWTLGYGDFIFKNIEVSGCHGYDGSHANEAMRKDGSYGNLTVQNCYIHDCENGIFTNQAMHGEVLVEYTEVHNCGTGHESSGACHNMYIGHISKFTLRNSVTRRATVGHLIKCRAKVTEIYNNRIFDGITGNSSNPINVPNFGQINIYNNKIVKGTMGQNPDVIRVGEDETPWEINTISVHDNDFDVFTLGGAHYGAPVVLGHFINFTANGVISAATLTNNTMWLTSKVIAPAVYHWRHYTTNAVPIDGQYPGATVESGTTIRTLPMTLDVTRPYLSGNLPVSGPLFRQTQYGGDTFPNFEGSYQWQDRDQINVTSSAGTGTTICNMYCSNELYQQGPQGPGTPNPFTAGTTWSIITTNVYYPMGTLPWATDGKYSVTSNSDGTGTLKVAGTLSSGVDYVQIRAAAPNGTLSDSRYPIVVA